MNSNLLRQRTWGAIVWACLIGLISLTTSCALRQPAPEAVPPGAALPEVPTPRPEPGPDVTTPPAPLPPPIAPAPPFVPAMPDKSRWVHVPWRELPDLTDAALERAWGAWLRNCERPSIFFADLCPEVRRMAFGPAPGRLDWLRTHFEAWRIEDLESGSPRGLLTAYYEPVFEARRQPDAEFHVPLYREPLGQGWGQRKPWYSRREIDTLAQPQAALAGRAIAWLRDPIEALVLHIQGSGRLRMTEPDGREHTVRLAFAATNDHPYQSVGRWLLDRGLVQDATWPGISAWVAANPERLQEMLWTNPRYVFFREEALDPLDPDAGPRGALGVPLSAGHSIAVDPHSIPYGTPVWLASPGPTVLLSRLVFAQDTGGAITGAVRADWFMGRGPQVGDVAGRVKQDVYLWALWPRKHAARVLSPATP